MISPATLELAVPDDLRELDQWIVWRRENSGGSQGQFDKSSRLDRVLERA